MAEAVSFSAKSHAHEAIQATVDAVELRRQKVHDNGGTPTKQARATRYRGYDIRRDMHTERSRLLESQGDAHCKRDGVAIELIDS